LEQLQVQKLSLTPALIQSMKLLQCSSFELSELINEELMTNPMLEASDIQPNPQLPKDTDMRFDWTEHAKERSYDDPASKKLLTKSEREYYNYEQFIKADISLCDYLYQQLSLLKLSPKMHKLSSYIIGTVNSNGYRTERATEIANKFGFTHEEVIKAIKIVQSLDPAGIAAKSLPECLELQLQRKEIYDEFFRKIIFEHLDDLAANRLRSISKELNIPLAKVIYYCNEIKKLDPKPGTRFGKGENNKYIVPELEIKELDGEYLVFQNEGIAPLINCSPYYDRLLKEAEGDIKTTEYLHDKMNSALMLIKGIDQRRATIQSIAEEIVKRQRGFLKDGPIALKAMTQEEIAKALGIHESTVSRAVNGKYIQTPQGLFELKYFFKTSVSSVTGAEQSSETVKKQIADILSQEDPQKPYSDEKIKSLLLHSYGTDIARRTIAKYREQLGIAGASKRKKY